MNCNLTLFCSGYWRIKGEPGIPGKPGTPGSPGLKVGITYELQNALRDIYNLKIV